ncbi:hypothetical protein ABZX40_17840 [Streptomyces sp. NPDC004610]|uniref:hypothetical protein n=1 Tax=unclassified Streptomyces TaxID=2593676 RepID=UPI0033B43C16
MRAAAEIIAKLEAGHAVMNAAGLGSAALDAFYDLFVKAVAGSSDPDATVSEMVQLIARENDRAARCRLHPDWCVQTGPHYDHESASVEVVDTKGETMLDAFALHFSESTPGVCIGESDFTAEQARDKAAELRRFADRVDELAAHVDKASA